jgi:hypothetical protein
VTERRRRTDRWLRSAGDRTEQPAAGSAARPARWAAAWAVAYNALHHLGALPGGLGDAGGATRWVDWLDLLTPYAVVGTALAALAAARTDRAAGPSRRSARSPTPAATACTWRPTASATPAATRPRSTCGTRWSATGSGTPASRSSSSPSPGPSASRRHRPLSAWLCSPGSPGPPTPWRAPPRSGRCCRRRPGGLGWRRPGRGHRPAAAGRLRAQRGGAGGVRAVARRLPRAVDALSTATPDDRAPAASPGARSRPPGRPRRTA